MARSTPEFTSSSTSRPTRSHRSDEASACRSAAQELQQQPAHLLGPLLLHPVSRALNEMRTAPLRADLGHAFECAGKLVDTPVAFAGDVAGRHVDGAAGENLKLGQLPLAVCAPVPLQPALEAGAAKLRRI